jgi:4-hydroxybenzoate polyprenyltransferase
MQREKRGDSSGHKLPILSRIKVFLDMIKFEHTIFALPFAYVGAFLAARGVPDLKSCLFILLAMVGGRTVAMGVNRIVDYHFDAKNPRTSDRPLVTGAIGQTEAWVMVAVAALVYFFACANLTPLALKLSPFILAILVFYSYTKRFTPLCHLFLGLGIGITPTAGWIAVQNSITLTPILLSLGVMFWIAGFDILYACQDTEFDRKEGLHSIPASIGVEKAFVVSSIFHAIAFAAFVAAGLSAGLSWIYYLGTAITFILLVLQRRVITPRDLSRMNIAFFRLNAAISIILFTSTTAAIFMGS